MLSSGSDRLFVMGTDWSKETLGDRLKHLMAELGYKGRGKQNEFGRKAGVESGPMSRLVNYDKPDGGAKGAELAKIAGSSAPASCSTLSRSLAVNILRF